MITYQEMLLIYSIMIAFCGSFLFGYTTCVIGGALPFLIQEFHLSPLEEGVLVSIILAGAMVGSMIGGVFHNRCRALLLTGIIFVVGIFFSTINHFEIFLFGRAVTGVGVGLASMLVPLYLAEISPARYRGVIGSMTMLGISIGLFTAYLVDYFFSKSGNWQLMFGLGLIPAFVLFIGMFFAIETPHWSVASDEKIRTKKLWVPPFRHLVIVGILLSLAQQFTGINVVNYYAPQIFKTAGFDSPESQTEATLGIGFITVVAALAATWLIDKWGRRPLLMISLIGMALALGTLSIGFFLNLETAVFRLNSSSLGLIALITLPLYTAAFTIGMGSALWVYLSEMYPSSIRSKALSLAVLFNWMGNYFISLVFPEVHRIWGSEIVFAFFAILSLITFVFIRHLPETKGKELI